MYQRDGVSFSGGAPKTYTRPSGACTRWHMCPDHVAACSSSHTALLSAFLPACSRSQRRRGVWMASGCTRLSPAGHGRKSPMSGPLSITAKDHHRQRPSPEPGAPSLDGPGLADDEALATPPRRQQSYAEHPHPGRVQQNTVGLSTGGGLAIVATRTRVVEREALYWQLLAQGVARWRPAGRSESAARPAIGGGQNWAESAH
jgi:hypothetical protein